MSFFFLKSLFFSINVTLSSPIFDVYVSFLDRNHARRETGDTFEGTGRKQVNNGSHIHYVLIFFSVATWQTFLHCVHDSTSNMSHFPAVNQRIER